MKNIKTSIVAGLLLASTAAFGGTITGSPHDLSSDVGERSGLASVTQDNGEICVYCHTPHAGNNVMAAAGRGAPLWNKTPSALGAGTPTNFTMYGATIGSTAQAAEPANASLACLTCHDGVSSIDSMVNAPGAGPGAGAGLADRNISVVLGNLNADIGQLAGAGLAKTHPISIEYDPTADGTKKGSLKATDTALTGWMGATDIASVLRSGNIECGSCHDPHNGTATTAALRATEVNFLRHSNTNSDLCLGCHNK